jgi:NADPH-dependent 2,4-dienoyl-CoA reductase/sulfur reductase-like enzyme
MHLVAIGGSDAGISAGLRARELDPTAEVTVVVADAYPNFSICGIPYYISGEVTHWRNLAHRSVADLEGAGLTLRLDTVATAIDVLGRRVAVREPGGSEKWLTYDELVVGTGALPVHPPIGGLDELGVEDGVHLLHSMGDTFALTANLERLRPETALIVGAGYVGLEMAEGLTSRGIAVTQIEMLQEVLPTVDPELGVLVREELRRNGVQVRTHASVTRIAHTGVGDARLHVDGKGADGQPLGWDVDLVLVVVGVRPDTSLLVGAGARTGARGAVVVDEAMRTGLPHVWAAGDCVHTHHRLLGVTYLPLGTTAHKQGRVAGENAVGGTARFAGSLGTPGREGLRPRRRPYGPAPPGSPSSRVHTSDHAGHSRRPQGVLPRGEAHRDSHHRRRGHRQAPGRPARGSARHRDRQASGHLRRRSVPQHDGRRTLRPRPFL